MGFFFFLQKIEFNPIKAGKSLMFYFAMEIIQYEIRYFFFP